MPMHDWTRVPPPIYHHFHQQWTIAICDVLNAGLLTGGCSALVEPHSLALYPNALAVERRLLSCESTPGSGAATLEPPRTRLNVRLRQGTFHERANRIVIRHHLGEVICAIEIVSPGNKSGKKAVRDFVEKSVAFLKHGVSLLVVDPFPAGANDPNTLHELIWNEFDEGAPFALPADEPLLLASYRASGAWSQYAPEAYIEPLAVGAAMPDMPAWLGGREYVNVPLEKTYRAAWDVCPADFRSLVENGELLDE